MKGQVNTHRSNDEGHRPKPAKLPLHQSTRELRKVKKHDIYNSRRCSPKFQGSLTQIVRFRKKNKNVPAKKKKKSIKMNDCWKENCIDIGTYA